MDTNTNTLPANVIELKSLLDVLKQKEQAGLILPSYAKAASLIRWAESGRPLTEKQSLFVGRLIVRARRKHTKDTRFNNMQGTVTTPPADVNAVAEKVMELLGDDKDNAVDVDAIIERVTKSAIEHLETRKPREVVIKMQQASGKTKPVKGPAHANFEKLVRAANARLPNGYAPGIFLQGEASSGKTTGAKMLAEALGLKWHFNGAISFPHEMLGFIDGAGKYHRTPFRDAYEHGGVYTFDEVDRSDPVALLAVNPHLANGVATFPDKQVKRHPDCIIICTANTWGLGADANYSGATKLDAAFLSRFPIRISWDIDSVLEDKIVDNADWLARIRKVRERARAVGLKVMVDTRIAQAGSTLIAQGFSMDEAASMTYLANMKPEQRKQVEEN